MAFVPNVSAARYPTLVDVAKRTDPDGTIATVAELLSETNEILDDAVFLEGNTETGHRTTVRADLPAATWRRLNYGVRSAKSKTAQVTDTIGMLEIYAELDKDLAMLNGNEAEFRLSEDMAFLEGINNQMANTMFYGDTNVNPDRFLGLAPRYNTLGVPAGKPNANNYGDHVLDGGGTGNDLTSLWLVVWGPNTVHMIFPKGSKAGLQREDKGQQTLYDPEGNQFEGYRTHYQWKNGLCVRDWRYVVRIANLEIDVAFPDNLLIQAINTIPNLRLGKPVIYCNRNIKTRLDIAAKDKSNVYLTLDKDPFGRPQTEFWGIPVRQADALIQTEAALV